MVISVEDLLIEKTKTSEIEKEIDEYLTIHFNSNKPEKKIKYLLQGKNKKYYKKNFETINELYQNAGWNIEHEIWPNVGGYRTEELIFRAKK